MAPTSSTAHVRSEPRVDYSRQHRFFLRFGVVYVPWLVATTVFAGLPLADDGWLRFAGCTAAIVVPITAFVAAYRRSAAMRDTFHRLDLAALHQFQVGRLAGIGMLALYAVHQLDGVFALWAGGIDVFVGLTATFVAQLIATADPLRRWRRRLLLTWNTLGLTDFVVALAIWFLWGPTSLGVFAGDGPGTGQMLQLPLSFIPMAGVAIVAIAHITAILQLRRGSSAPAPVFATDLRPGPS